MVNSMHVFMGIILFLFQPLVQNLVKRFGGGDLFINSKTTPTIDVSSFGDHFTLIFKYNLINYNRKLFLGYFLGFSLYVYDAYYNKGYYGFGNGGAWWAYPYGFGNIYNTNYELAIEVKPGQLKIWLNGKMVSKTDHPTAYRVKPYIYFGNDDVLWRPQFYLNDIFCINKSEFLPDQYNVNWNEPWYELRYKHIYTHHDEAFYTK